jgi:hypothetical protein
VWPTHRKQRDIADAKHMPLRAGQFQMNLSYFNEMDRTETFALHEGLGRARREFTDVMSGQMYRTQYGRQYVAGRPTIRTFCK